MSLPVLSRPADRRAFLQTFGVGAAAAYALASLPANATADAAKAFIAKLTGGKEPVMGKVTLTMPEIAENGANVPLTVVVESPMTEASYVKSIHVAADGNPSPEVASFHLTPVNARAEVQTRMRMSVTQNVWAVAEMSDGAVYMAKTEVKVTIGGCGG
jgi:sulfur-oxidizing protein SoxY